MAATFADLQLSSQNDIPPLTIEPAYLPPDFSLGAAVCNDPNCNCQQGNAPSPSRSQNVITRSLSLGRPAPEMVGPFVLGPTLGRGQTGKVRLGVHKDTGFEVAIKIINKRLFKEDKQQRQRVEREVAILKLIDHPHVMKLYDVWETRRHLFIVMEHVDSGELFDYILRRGRLPRHEALRFVAQIVQGLEHCHLYSICHRDLKPENILLDRDHNVKIADFGMATIMKYGAHLNTSCGSPHYTSPEVVSGGKYDGKLSDVWSVGVVLFALVTAQLPFDHENTIGLLKIVRRGVYKIPDFVDPDIADLIQRMLTVQPEHRIRMWEIKHHRCFTSAPPVPLTYSVSPASRGPVHGHFSFLARRSSEPHVQKFEDTIHVTYFPQSAYEEDQRRCHGDCHDCIQNQDKLGYAVACSNASRNGAHLGVAQAAPLKSADDIDINVLDDLYHLGWGSRNELIAVLLSPLPNLEQVFYHLLLQRKNERLKNLEDLQIGSSTPPQAPVAPTAQPVEPEPVIFLPPVTPTNNSAQIGSNPLASPLMPVGKHKVSSIPSPIGPHSATSAADVAVAAAVGTLIEDEYDAAMPMDPSFAADDFSLPLGPVMPPAAVASTAPATLVMPPAIASVSPTPRESSPRISVDIGKSADVQIRLLALPDMIDETPALPRPSHSRALSDPMSAAASRDATTQPAPASRASTAEGQEGASTSSGAVNATVKTVLMERGEPAQNLQKPSNFSQQLPPNQPVRPVPTARRVESRVGSLSPVQRGLAAPIAPSSIVARDRDRWVAPQMERVEEGGSAVGSESAEECGSSRPPQPSPQTVDDSAQAAGYGATSSSAMSQLASAFSSAGICEQDMLHLTTQLEGLTMPTEDKQALSIPELSLDAPFPTHPRSRSASSPRVIVANLSASQPVSSLSMQSNTSSSPVSPLGANFSEGANAIPPAARFLPNPGPYGGSMPMIVNRDGIPMLAAVRHAPQTSVTSSSLPNPAPAPAPGFCSPVSAVSTAYEASVSSNVSAYSVPYPDADREFDDRERDSEPVTPSSTSTNPSFGSNYTTANSTATSPSPFAPQTPTVTYSTPRFHRTRVVPQNHPMLPRPAPHNTILQGVPVTPSSKRSWLSSLFNFAPPYPQKVSHNPARRTGPLPSTTVPNSMGSGIHYSPPPAVCSPDGIGPVASGQTVRATSLGSQPSTADTRSSASKRLPPLQLP